MTDKSKESAPPNHCGHDDMYCKVLSAFLALSSYLIFQIIDITSRHYAVAFKIPIHNIGIFFDKLFSLRVLLILAGNMIEYGIFHAAGADRDTGDGDKNKGKRVRRYIAVTAFAAGLYFSKELGYHAYVSLSFEGFPFGISDSAFMPLIAQYMSVVAIMFNMTQIQQTQSQQVSEADIFEDDVAKGLFDIIIDLCLSPDEIKKKEEQKTVRNEWEKTESSL
nr:hypothetical protein MACL_00000105 [Theileria orientalis]